MTRLRPLCCRAASAIASARAAAGRLPQAVRLPRLLRRGAENRIGVSDMRIWMFRFEQNAHFNPLGRSLLRLSYSAGGCGVINAAWFVPASALVRPCCDTPLIRPCRLLDVIPDIKRSHQGRPNPTAETPSG